MDVRISQVSKTYPARPEPVEALRRVDLSVGSGEFVALLGASGSGKTTLLELVAGLARPSSGEVLVGGQVVTGPARERAMVFQDYALFPWRTVEGNLQYVLEVQRAPRSEWRERCSHYLDLVQLHGFRRAYPRELSGGMRQRVALARALVGEPQVLLMDEPFGALDAITRHQLQLMLKRIIEQSRKTVVFVTHSIDEALLLADRVAILTPRPGRVREIITVPGAATERDVATPALVELARHVWDVLDADLNTAQPEARHEPTEPLPAALRSSSA